MFLQVVSVLLIALVTNWFYHFIKFYKYLHKIPGPRVWPIIGNILEFKDIKRTIYTLDRCMRRLKTKSMRLHNGFHTGVLTKDYQLIEALLSSQREIDRGYEYECIRTWLGNGIFISNGKTWRQQRKTLMPALYTQHYPNFLDVIVRNANLMVDCLRKTLDQSSVDIAQFCTLCTLDIICEIGMGININAQNGDNEDYVRAIHKITSISAQKFCYLVYNNPMTYKWTKKFKQEQNVMKIINNYTDKFFQERRDILNQRNDKNVQNDMQTVYLDVLFEATIDGKPLTQQMMRDEINVYIFGGHDTSAITLAFAMFELSRNPDIQLKAFEEINNIFGSDLNRPCTYEDTTKMKYLDGIIKETLRLYPPGPFVSRKLQKDMTIDGITYPKDVTIAVCVYGVHHDESYYDDPEKFDPDRFVVHQLDTKRPFSFLAFSKGPRNCVGQKFGMFQLRILLSTILRKFEIVPAKPVHCLDLVNSMVIGSANGIRVRLQNRSL
ncbi:probable cytochrome P450 4d14 isoform X1 [Atheta coriaria]|uniref:probable cytochrome P450 4d14 isoform X1 n=1 Tax=Dalotia coriaria TaxID=877792 RepID=UPI0031F44985